MLKNAAWDENFVKILRKIDKILMKFGQDDLEVLEERANDLLLALHGEGDAPRPRVLAEHARVLPVRGAAQALLVGPRAQAHEAHLNFVNF